MNEMIRMMQINDAVYPVGKESRDFISNLNKLSHSNNKDYAVEKERFIVNYLVKYPEQEIIFKENVEDYELLYTKNEYFDYEKVDIYNDYHKKLIQSLYKNRKSKEINYNI